MSTTFMMMNNSMDLIMNLVVDTTTNNNSAHTTLEGAIEKYKIDDSTYSFVDAGGLKGTFSIDQNYNLLTLIYNDVDLLALHQV